MTADTPVRSIHAANLEPLAPRPVDCHKGQLGHVLVIGGDVGMGGAGLLSAQAALRCGAGMVSLATREQHIGAALSRLPEVMACAIRASAELRAPLQRATVLVVGPGLGQSPWSRALLSSAAQHKVIQVWDADALNMLADTICSQPQQCILTPHPGEAARLLKTTTAQVQTDRCAAVLAIAQRYNAVTVLKGHHSLIATPQGELSRVERGHPVMAGAGFGDVLSGVIAALLAQGLSAYPAACLAVWLHACAGEQLASQGRGLVASEMCERIRQLLEEHSPCQA
ncbi:MAG: NAD(P)H-hydrate dehydratase [Gammaproteobacteria bacterium]|nr:NAD(P)H-hydrate dehydratase [Gammaproteobacteria bacterium]